MEGRASVEFLAFVPAVEVLALVLIQVMLVAGSGLSAAAGAAVRARRSAPPLSPRARRARVGPGRIQARQSSGFSLAPWAECRSLSAPLQ